MLIKELNITVYHEFQKLYTMAMYVNPTYMNAITQVYTAYNQALKANDSEKANLHLLNAIIALNGVSNGALSYYYKALAVINGKDHKHYINTPHEHVQSEVHAKEKLIRHELENADFQNAEPIIYLNKRITRVKALDRWIRKKDESQTKKIEEIEKFFLQKSPKIDFHPESPSNFIKQYDKAFEKNCISISEVCGVSDIKSKSVYEFFALIEYCKDKEKALKKGKK